MEGLGKFDRYSGLPASLSQPTGNKDVKLTALIKDRLRLNDTLIPSAQPSKKIKNLNKQYCDLLASVTDLFVCRGEKEYTLAEDKINSQFLSLEQAITNAKFLPGGRKLHATEQITELRKFVQGQRDSLISFSHEIFKFDLVTDSIVEHVFGQEEGKGPLFALSDIQKAVYHLDRMELLIEDLRELPGNLFAEELTKRLRSEVKEFSWLIEDWAEGVIDTVDKEQTELRSFLRQTQKPSTNTPYERQLRALHVQLQSIDAGLDGVISQVASNGHHTHDILYSLNRVKKLTSGVSNLKSNTQVAPLVYGSEEWDSLVKARPKTEKSWFQRTIAHLTESENWSDRTKQVVYGVFLGMQISSNVLDFANRLGSQRTEDMNTLPAAQERQIEKESAVLENLLSDKFQSLKEFPESVQHLTKRYPHVRDSINKFLEGNSKTPSLSTIQDFVSDFRLQRLAEASAQNVGTPHVLPELVSNSPTTAKSSGIGLAVFDWIGRLWQSPDSQFSSEHERMQSQLGTVQNQIKDGILKTHSLKSGLSQLFNHELHDELTMHAQSLSESIKETPNVEMPFLKVAAWEDQVRGKIEAIKKLEVRVNGMEQEKMPVHVEEEYAYALSLGGGHYDPNVKMVIPADLDLVQRAWKKVKHDVSSQIGEVSPKVTKETYLWNNSAQDAKALELDAQELKEPFKVALREIANKVGGEANFGPGGKFATKSYESLSEKIETDSRIEGISAQEATAKIGDALRGSILIHSPEQMQPTIKAINEWVQAQGGKVAWKDMFAEERSSGYVGVHGKIFLVADGVSRPVQILCEIQINFVSINDGSLTSPKETAHVLYKKADLPTEIVNGASQLAFLSGLASVGDESIDPEFLKKTI